MAGLMALSVFLGVKMSAELRDRLRAAAQRQDRPMSSVLRRILADGLTNDERSPS
jgi:predicted DNA-binding protein